MTTLFPGVALITGAASGIGRQTALSFATESCLRITICDRNLAGLLSTEKLIQEISSKCEALNCEVDMLKENEVEGCVVKTVERWGRVDYGVNVAGVMGDSKPSLETPSAIFDTIDGINYRGAWLSSRAEIKQMAGKNR